MVIKSLLFDLDDTLLSSKPETFLPAYFKVLTEKLQDLVPPDKLVQQILASTRLMVYPPHPDRTNKEVFEADFFPKIGIPREILLPIFEDFYAHDFGKLRSVTKPKPEAREVIVEAFRCCQKVVIATQPVFPITAIRQRLEWAGIGDFPYTLITSYENMHACKPSKDYFLEIASFLGLQPQECLMIGNDLQQDILPAGQAGLATCWITESQGVSAECNLQGTLSDLRRWLQNGPIAL